MLERFSRTRLIYGEEAMRRFSKSRVAVFGIGGVGGYTVEALARSGIGSLELIDSDTVALTNLNRQIIATEDSIGRYKVDVAAERVKSINPDCEVVTHRLFYLPKTAELFDFTGFDYVVDAIDTVKGKLAIAQNAIKAGVPVISSMGAGNKTDASAFEVADIYETSVCPLAKVMRRECRRLGIEALKVVYSKEKPRRPLEDEFEAFSEAAEASPEKRSESAGRRDTPGSTAFVPSVAGLIIAGEVINDLAGIRRGSE